MRVIPPPLPPPRPDRPPSMPPPLYPPPVPPQQPAPQWPAPAVKRPPALIVYLLGLLGGVAGTLAAVLDEMSQGVWLAAIFVVPAIEEICKPIAIIFILEKRPHWFRSAAEVFLLAVLGAVVFSVLENLVYIYVYAPHEGPAFAVFRFTVCLSVHVAATAVLGAGLASMWRRMHTKGVAFSVEYCFRYYLVAAALHALYNTGVAILHVLDVKLY